VNGNVIADLGLGVYEEMDVVIGCLDNREARLWINRQCWKVGTPWVDGAIQEISGVVKVFVPPDSACYECGMTERDYQLINLKYSCPLLKREDIAEGKVPTAPTISSRKPWSAPWRISANSGQAPIYARGCSRSSATCSTPSTASARRRWRMRTGSTRAS
jgi:hypothetical protein